MLHKKIKLRLIKMKKAIKFLSFLFLVDGLSNLVSSQNFQTLATNCCCRAVKVTSAVKMAEKVRQQLLKENKGVLLEVNTNKENCSKLDSYYQYASISISEDILNAAINDFVTARFNDIVSINIFDRKDRKYSDSESLFSYKHLKNDPEYINNFTNNDYGYDESGLLSPKVESVDEGFNFKVGETYKFMISVNDQEIFNQKVKAIEELDSANITQLTNKIKKQNSKINKSKKNRKSNTRTCVPV